MHTGSVYLVKNRKWCHGRYENYKQSPKNNFYQSLLKPIDFIINVAQSVES